MSKGVIKRDAHISNYTCISNSVWQDDKLSWRAKAFLGFLLSLPDTWEFSYAGLCDVTGLSRKTIYNLFNELKEAHYFQMVKMTPNETASKKYEYVYKIYEVPFE